MRKKWSILALLVLGMVLLGACSQGASGSSEPDDTINIVWYPNESGNELKASRDAIGQVISDATGKVVEHQLTTDYAIAIETIANGNADIAFLGAEGYVEASGINDAVQPLVVASGESGTLDDAMYNSWFAANEEEQDQFKVDDEFSLDMFEGKRMSFVSTSSTSGFAVPTSTLTSYFSDLTEEDLMQGGSFFSQVLFGGSHQGSAVNLLTGNADVAAFCDTCVGNYVEVAEGEPNTVGAVYEVQENAAAPFQNLAGERFVLMDVTPVLNAPFAANMEALGEEDYQKIQEALTSDKVANNEQIFASEDSDQTALFEKTADERFVPVEDEWFNPIREL